MKLFDAWYGSFDTWFQVLKNNVNNPNEFSLLINTNKKNRKLEKLKHSELIL